jgi:hypothetical protein
MFSLKTALSFLALVCFAGIVFKLVLRRFLQEVDGMHKVHERSSHSRHIWL